jgi:uncharacterized coiled-coil protein SlyX
MKKFITIFPLLVLLAMAACTGNSTFERQLAVADSLMRHNYDSAYTLLKDMDSMAQHMPERLRMKHMLLRANAQNKAWEFFTSDSTGKTLTKYYDRNGTPNERMLAHYIKGCAYRDMGDEPMALQCFNEAVAAADTADTQCDFYQLSIIYGQIASIFKLRALPDEALEAYAMAERYAWRCNDTRRVLNIWSNKSEMLISKDRIGEALQLKEKTAQWHRRMGNKKSEAKLLGQCIKWLARLGELEKAKKYMDIYENHSGDFLPNRMVKPGNEGYYNTKGTYYLELGKLDSALYFFRKLRDERMTVEGQYNAAWGMAQTYERHNSQDSLAKYSLKTLILYDSIYNLKAAENLQNLQAMYNYANHRKVAQRKALEAKEAQLSRRNWIIGALSALSATFLLTLLAFWLRGQVRHKQQKLQEASKENEILHAKVKEKATTIEELNSYVAERTEIINSLNEQLNKNSINIEEYHKQAETIQILNKKIENFERDILHRIDAQKINQLSDNKAIITIRELLDTRRCCPTENEWLALYDIAEKYFPTLCSIKANPKISSIEYQICVLTKLLFEVNEIVFLTGKSNSFITAKRKRMLPKLFNCTGSAKDFDNRIIGL